VAAAHAADLGEILRVAVVKLVRADETKIGVYPPQAVDLDAEGVIAGAVAVVVSHVRHELVVGPGPAVGDVAPLECRPHQVLALRHPDPVELRRVGHARGQPAYPQVILDETVGSQEGASLRRARDHHVRIHHPDQRALLPDALCVGRHPEPARNGAVAEHNHRSAPGRQPLDHRQSGAGGRLDLRLQLDGRLPLRGAGVVIHHELRAKRGV